MSDAAFVTQAEFARQQGWAKSYVTKLKGEGRLVLREDGLVDVLASLELIKASSGAPERAAPAVQGRAYSDAQDRERFYSAELKRIELEERVGKLVPLEQAEGAWSDALTLLRGALESMPVRMAAVVSGMAGDEHRIRAALAEQVEAALTEVARRVPAALQGKA